MAAIMIFLKSKFLVNKDKDEDVKKVTRFLTNRLTILELLNKNSKTLFELPKFEEEFFPNKNKFKLKVEKSYIIKDKLYDLLKAYTNIYRRNQNYTLKFSSIKLFSIKDGQKVLKDKISSYDDWFSLESLMPEKLQNKLLNKSFISSTFGAGLQMAKKSHDSEKTLVIKQAMPFTDIYYKNMSNTIQKVEALIFSSIKPIKEDEIKKRLDLHEDISPMLNTLANDYANKGINLRNIGNGWIFVTNENLSEIFHEKRQIKKKLSKQAIETLSIVAYHQPITKSEVEGIRGVIIGQGILDQLMELNWIQPGGRKEVPGRPILWNTTDDFLLHFGLGTLDNLPGIEELRNSGILNENFSSLNIQEVSDSLDSDDILVDDTVEEENLDDFSQSQLDNNSNDT